MIARIPASDFVNTNEIIAGLYEYHKLFDIYNTYEGINNLATVNSKAGDGEWIKVDRRIIDLLVFSKEMYTLTDGEVNIAFGAVLKLWHDKRMEAIKNPDAASLPDINALRAAAEHISLDFIEIDESASSVRISDGGASIDVGAIAKGYATERVARELESYGVSGYLLNVGGNVRVVGAKPGGSLWRIGIENPFDGGDDYIEQISLSSGAVVTSGAHQRYFIYGGKKYNHLIDKDTLSPGENFESVTVICPDSGMADALSTALFLMDYESAGQLLSDLGGIEAVFVMKDGSVKRIS
jgi:thiamine biosynthesis lipoprotein